MTGPGGEHTTEHQEPRELRVAEGHSAGPGHGGGPAGPDQHSHGAPAHDGGAHGPGDHGADAQGAGGHGGHGDEMTLGPIDMTAWIIGLAGVAIGLIVALSFALSTGNLG